MQEYQLPFCNHSKGNPCIYVLYLRIISCVRGSTPFTHLFLGKGVLDGFQKRVESSAFAGASSMHENRGPAVVPVKQPSIVLMRCAQTTRFIVHERARPYKQNQSQGPCCLAALSRQHDDQPITRVLARLALPGEVHSYSGHHIDYILWGETIRQQDYVTLCIYLSTDIFPARRLTTNVHFAAIIEKYSTLL